MIEEKAAKAAEAEAASGTAHMDKSEFNQAVADFETAVKLAPDNASYRESLTKAKAIVAARVERLRRRRAMSPVTISISVISSVLCFHLIYISHDISVVVGSVINGAVLGFLLASYQGVGVAIIGAIIGLIGGGLADFFGGVRVLWAIVTLLGVLLECCVYLANSNSGDRG
jgi:hypothetical protein